MGLRSLRLSQPDDAAQALQQDDRLLPRLAAGYELKIQSTTWVQSLETQLFFNVMIAWRG